MEILDCIKTRRSRRLFLDKEVEEEKLKTLIEAAVQAPSSQDCQPWHFVVVKSNDIKKKLADLKEESNRQHTLTASVVIVVCVDIEKSPSRFIEDGVTATQNILLTAHSLGLGAVYVTGYKMTQPETADSIREILNLPQNIIPLTVLPIGYADAAEATKDKEVIDATSVTHADKW